MSRSSQFKMYFPLLFYMVELRLMIHMLNVDSVSYDSLNVMDNIMIITIPRTFRWVANLAPWKTWVTVLSKAALTWAIEIASSTPGLAFFLLSPTSRLVTLGAPYVSIQKVSDPTDYLGKTWEHGFQHHSNNNALEFSVKWNSKNYSWALFCILYMWARALALCLFCNTTS